VRTNLPWGRGGWASPEVGSRTGAPLTGPTASGSVLWPACADQVTGRERSCVDGRGAPKRSKKLTEAVVQVAATRRLNRLSLDACKRGQGSRPRAAPLAPAPARKCHHKRAEQPLATANRRLPRPTDSPTLSRVRASRLGEYHPQPLSERCVNHSIHTAPIKQTHPPSRVASARKVAAVSQRAFQER